MDNLCHTLVGAALAQSGLKRRTPLATATLLVAANLPDADVISLAWGSTAGLGFRRGWTHGALALALWPFLLAAAMLLLAIAFAALARRSGRMLLGGARPDAVAITVPASVATALLAGLAASLALGITAGPLVELFTRAAAFVAGVR